MRRIGPRLAVAISGFLAIAAVIGFVLNLNGAVAQSPNQRPQPGQWDMWNPNWMQRDMWHGIRDVKKEWGVFVSLDEVNGPLGVECCKLTLIRLQLQGVIALHERE